MLKFQWNALGRGDTVFVHDAADADLGLRAGVVTLVDVHQPGHDVGVRLTTDTPSWPVVRPAPFAVHDAAVNDHDCWRSSGYAFAIAVGPGSGRGRELRRGR